MARLDRQLDYLWRVHRVDFYAGEELSTAEADAARGARMQRPPRPEEGEQATEADGEGLHLRCFSLPVCSASPVSVADAGLFWVSKHLRQTMS